LGKGYGIKCDAIENSGKTMVVWLSQLTRVRTLSQAHRMIKSCGLIWNHFGNPWELGNIFGNIIWKPVEKPIQTWGTHREHRGGRWVPGFVLSAPIRLRVHMSILRTTQFSTQPAGYEFIS
jgi:hypothetical protein